MVYIRNAIQLKTPKERSSLMAIATAAYCGFSEMGEKIEFFTDIDKIYPEKEDIVVGSVSDTEKIFARFGIELPTVEYPEELSAFYGRKIWTEPSLRNLIKEERMDIFIKPAVGVKKFSGKAIRKPTDYCNLIFDGDFPIICSELADIVSEWRCYVRYGEILSLKNYAGDPFAVPNREFIEAALDAYKSAPAGYSLDVAVLGDGKNIVVEVNDGYSLGAYGILPVPYAKLLSARFSQLMGVSDNCF